VERNADVDPLLYLAFLVVAILGTALGAYALIERPFMLMRTRFTGTRPAVATPVAEELGKEPEPEAPEPVAAGTGTELAGRPAG
jgi:hypothetical protein